MFKDQSGERQDTKDNICNDIKTSGDIEEIHKRKAFPVHDSPILKGLNRIVCKANGKDVADPECYHDEGVAYVTRRIFS